MIQDVLNRARGVKARYLAGQMARRGVFRTSVLRPEDTMIVGFPKSGHTWMQSLIASLSYGLDPRVADDVLIQDLTPDLHQARWHKRYGEAMCFKSHMFPRRDFRRAIYLVRDGRDVMVSYYHFRKAWGFGGSLMDLIDEEHPEYGSWTDHVNAWLDNPHGAEILYLRYEALLANTPSALGRVCDFLGLQRSAADLSEAADRCSFKNMRAKEDRVGRPNKHWPRDKKFMRRGVAGSYQDEMPPEAQDAFMARSGATMARIAAL